MKEITISPSAVNALSEQIATKQQSVSSSYLSENSSYITGQIVYIQIKITNSSAMSQYSEIASLTGISSARGIAWLYNSDGISNAGKTVYIGGGSNKIYAGEAIPAGTYVIRGFAIVV